MSFNLTVMHKYNVEAISRSIDLYLFNLLLKIPKINKSIRAGQFTVITCLLFVLEGVTEFKTALARNCTGSEEYLFTMNNYISII